jgi:hypothetical protein
MQIPLLGVYHRFMYRYVQYVQNVFRRAKGYKYCNVQEVTAQEGPEIEKCMYVASFLSE